MDLNLFLVLMMFGTFALLLFSGYPIAFVLGGAGVLFALLGEILFRNGFDVDVGIMDLGLVVNRLYGVMSNYGLVPIPLFIFMGHMLDRSGIAVQLLKSVQILFGRAPGGLAIGVTLMGVLLAASTGIIGASIALLGTLALPTLLKSRYQPELAVGTICSAGTLGILIPPSIMLVLMADQMLVSLVDLFMAAVFPGLILSGLYVTYIFGFSVLRPDKAPPICEEEQRNIGQNKLHTLLTGLLPPAGLIIAVLGVIFFGIASPSEAAGVGAAGAVFLAIANGKFSVVALKEATYATGKTTAFIFAIFLGANCFSVVLRGLGGDDVIIDLLTGHGFGHYGTLFIILGTVFALGFFLDWIEIVLIVLPLVQPVIPTLGFDPIWFTVLVAVCLQTSFLTPPVGFALFYLKGVSPPQITVGHLYRGVVPFVFLQLVGLMIVFYWPDIATWLPSKIYQ
ncbi:MAG: TRAP transporter large permease subunit [Sneathiella sp.]